MSGIAKRGIAKRPQADFAAVAPRSTRGFWAAGAFRCGWSMTRLPESPPRWCRQGWEPWRRPPTPVA